MIPKSEPQYISYNASRHRLSLIASPLISSISVKEFLLLSRTVISEAIWGLKSTLFNLRVLAAHTLQISSLVKKDTFPMNKCIFLWIQKQFLLCIQYNVNVVFDVKHYTFLLLHCARIVSVTFYFTLFRKADFLFHFLALPHEVVANRQNLL